MSGRHLSSSPRSEKLPLDDSRWTPFPDVHRLFWQRIGGAHPEQHTGSSYHACADFRKALSAGALGSKVRYLPRERLHYPELPEQESLPADYWDDPTDIWLSSEGLLVWARNKRGRVFGSFFVWGPDVEKFFGIKTSTSATKPPRPGSADAWIDVVAPDGAWRDLTGKRLHSLAAQHIDDLNVMNEREAKKQSRKLPPKINCPGVRAFQVAVAKRRERERQGQAQ
jgi:hypothetical protein